MREERLDAFSRADFALLPDVSLAGASDFFVPHRPRRPGGARSTTRRLSPSHRKTSTLRVRSSVTVATKPDGVSTTVALRRTAPSALPPKEAWPVTDSVRPPSVIATLPPSNDGSTSRPPACGAGSPHSDAGKTRERTIPPGAALARKTAATRMKLIPLMPVSYQICADGAK